MTKCFHVPRVLFKSFICLVTLMCAARAFGAEPERSVVQIMTFSQRPAWDAPWRFEPVARSGGSGFVIKGKRIMTNAHVISWARQIIVQRYQDPRALPRRGGIRRARLRPGPAHGAG